MEFFNRLFGKSGTQNPKQNAISGHGAPTRYLEDDFTVTITDEYVKVEHPQNQPECIRWEEIMEIRLVNTDDGAWLPDVWYALIGKETGCLIPQGAPGSENLYDIISKYEGFNYQQVIAPMTCTDNAQFIVWTRPGA